MRFMKTLMILSALLPVMAVSQLVPKTYSLNDGALYVKEKTNLRGNLGLETGYSVPLASHGNVSLSGNVAFVQNVNNLFGDTSWTVGLAAGYRLNSAWSVYTKTATNLTGTWTQETGVRINILRTKNYSVTANTGYVFSYPFKNGERPNWTTGLTVSFPVRFLK